MNSELNVIDGMENDDVFINSFLLKKIIRTLNPKFALNEDFMKVFDEDGEFVTIKRFDNAFGYDIFVGEDYKIKANKKFGYYARNHNKYIALKYINEELGFGVINWTRAMSYETIELWNRKLNSEKKRNGR